MTPPLEGAAVRLRPLQLGDAAAVQQKFPHWPIVRYMGAAVPWPYPPDGALQYLAEQALPAMFAGVEHHWAIVSGSNAGELIGGISLLPTDTSGNQRGFWLSLEQQGKGLMFEAVELVTGFAFEELGMPQLELSNAEPNVASTKLKVKQGAMLVATEPGYFVSGPLPRQKWVLTRETWRTRCAG